MFSRARPVCPLTVRGGQKFQITGLQRVLSKANQTFAMFAKPPAPRGLQVFLLSSLTLARAPFSLNSCNTLNFLLTRNTYFCWCFSSMGGGGGIKLKTKKIFPADQNHMFSAQMADPYSLVRQSFIYKAIYVKLEKFVVFPRGKLSYICCLTSDWNIQQHKCHHHHVIMI